MELKLVSVEMPDSELGTDQPAMLQVRARYGMDQIYAKAVSSYSAMLDLHILDVAVVSIRSFPSDLE
jgi:hypothetical protein